MTNQNALHSRRHVAWRRSIGIVTLSISVMAIPALDKLIRIDTALASRGARWSEAALHIFQISTWVLCLGPLIAGLLVDRFGVIRVVQLALVAWCPLMIVGAVTAEPFTFLILSPLATNLITGILVTSAFVAIRQGMPPRRRAVASALIVMTYFYARAPSRALFNRLFGAFDIGDPTAWQYPLFALVTCGAGIAAIWLLMPPRIANAIGNRPPSKGAVDASVFRGLWGVVTQPIVWSLLLIELCAGIVLRLAYREPWNTGALGRDHDWVLLLPLYAAPIAFLLVAAWSDRILTQSRSLVTARQPFIVVGFALLAFIPLAAASGRDTLALTVVGIIGLAILRMVDLLVVDLAPQAAVGRFIGFVLSGELLLNIYVAPLLEQPAETGKHWTLLLSVTAITGAALSTVLLRKMREAET